MKRVLILGSSHVGALRRADDAFRSRFPEVETDYFAVKAPMLRRGKVEDGVFRPFVHSNDEIELLNTLNGRPDVDLGQYDKTLVVGFRTHPLEITELFQSHALLGTAPDDQRFRVSAGFVADCLGRTASDWAQDVKARFGETPDCVFMIGPYPAESIVERAGEIDFATRFKAFQDNPHAGILYDIWAASVEAAAADQGLGFLAQPAGTLAGPYATKAEFARHGTAADGETMEQGDHRHMNADFGLMVLEQFAIQHLDQHPRPS